MARKIIWTQKAQKDRLTTFAYWNDRNGSKLFSKKLNLLIENALELISKFTHIGRKTEEANVRVKVKSY